jgi:hypothetical protein
MKQFADYFVIVYFTLLIGLGLKGLYLFLKFERSLKKNHPEKAREYGYSQYGWCNSAKVLCSFYKKEDLGDPELHRVRRELKGTQILALLIGFIGFFILALSFIFDRILAPIHFGLVSIVQIIIGIFLLIFAEEITDLMLKRSTNMLPKPIKPIVLSLLYIWPIRFMGIICIVFAFVIARAGP